MDGQSTLNLNIASFARLPPIYIRSSSLSCNRDYSCLIMAFHHGSYRDQIHPSGRSSSPIPDRLDGSALGEGGGFGAIGDPCRRRDRQLAGHFSSVRRRWRPL